MVQTLRTPRKRSSSPDRSHLQVGHRAWTAPKRKAGIWVGVAMGKFRDIDKDREGQGKALDRAKEGGGGLVRSAL